MSTEFDWEHVKTGNRYRILHFAVVEATLQPVVIYRSNATGAVFSRPVSEFFDGRFRSTKEPEPELIERLRADKAPWKEAFHNLLGTPEAQEALGGRTVSDLLAEIADLKAKPVEADAAATLAEEPSTEGPDCRDCDHYLRMHSSCVSSDVEWLCSKRARSADGDCGPSGKYFKPKAK